MKNQSAWQTRLKTHCQELRKSPIKKLFEDDPQRVKTWSIETPHLLFDYSKNYASQETLSLLTEFAKAMGIEAKREALFSGQPINFTEKKPALHTALRQQSNPLVVKQLQRMRDFVSKLETGELQTQSGKPFQTIVNIGIGGSDLGSKLVVKVLGNHRTDKFNIKFISNIDAIFLDEIKHNLEKSLFIINSKSFTTSETLQNATTIKTWLLEKNLTPSNHFIATTACPKKALEFGVRAEQIFETWEWVGGRYSLWSASGLIITIALGWDSFERLLRGAHNMDEHFKTEPIHRNAPLMSGLLDVWYRNFFRTEALAFIPYDESLSLLPKYLIQLFMESNGKCVLEDNTQATHPTGAVILGGIGADAQHSFFQYLHQSLEFIPIDFFIPLKKRGQPLHHDMLVANCLAQAKILMLGAYHDDPHRSLAGNRPSTMIAYSELSPETLGSLLAFFEHRTFIQATLWGINPFDQWGVEVGKKTATELRAAISANNPSHDQDPSTAMLLSRYIEANT